MLFGDMIHGKSVAVIGGSNLLKGIGEGEYIDSHDVVLRVNLHWPCPLFLGEQCDLSVDIGKRTDILFQALSQWRVKRFLALNGPRLVVLRNWSDPIYPKIVKDCESKGVPVENFNPFYSHLYPSWNPNTGMLALITTLSENPKHIYVAGFDFSVFHNRTVNWINHDPDEDRKYFRDYISKDPRVEMHDIVRKAMESDYVQPCFRPQIRIL